MVILSGILELQYAPPSTLIPSDTATIKVAHNFRTASKNFIIPFNRFVVETDLSDRTFVELRKVVLNL